MGSFANYLENAAMNYLFSATALAAPTPWVGLHTDDPTEVGNVGELSTAGGSNYQRVKSTGWTAASSGYVYNNAAVQFSTAGTAWGAITYFSIWDANELGNCLAYSSLTVTKTIAIGDPVAVTVRTEGSLI